MPLPLEVQNVSVVNNLLELLGVDRPSRWEILPFVLPVAPVTNVDLAKVEKFAWGQFTVAPVAAQNSHLQIFNPADSGRLVHVASIIIFAAAVITPEIQEFDTALTTLGAAATTRGWRDRRQAGTPVAQLRSQTNAGALSTATRLRLQFSTADDMEEIPIDAFLEPGQGLVYLSGTVNIGITWSVYWDEKPL